jgi:hypothetical protein
MQENAKRYKWEAESMNYAAPEGVRATVLLPVYARRISSMQRNLAFVELPGIAALLGGSG